MFSASAQEFATRLYTPKDGLVQAQVFCITQGPQGYLWIGTLGGISRFDGLEFKNFTEEDGLLSNTVYDMQWFNDTLYILSKEGVDILVKSKLINVYHDKNRIFGRGHLKITSKYKYAFGSNYNYFFFLNLKTKTITRFSKKIQNSDHMVITMTDTSFILGKGKCLFEMPFGDTVYSKIMDFDRTVNRINIFNNILYVTFKYPEEHKPYFRVYYVKMIRKKRRFQITRFTGLNKIAYESTGCMDRISPTKSGITYGSFNYGGIFYEKGGRTIKFSDNYNKINRAYEDRNGIFWIATEKGLLKVFTGAFQYYRPEQGFVDNVWAAAGINDSLILMASFNQGIHLYNNGIEKKYVHSKKNIRSCYFGACYGFQNDLLLSVYPGVARYDVKQNKMSVIDDNLKEVNFTLFKDKKHNRVLVAQLRSLVAINNDYTTEKLFDVTSIGSNQYIISITTRNDKIILGLLRGLIEFDPETKHSRYILNDNTRFNSLVTDSKNTVWAATNKGLLKILNDTLYFINGIKKPRVLTSVIIDNNNKLYASSETSLYVLDLDKHYKGLPNQLKYFGYYDGYYGSSPQQDAFFKDKRGNLWLPTGYNVTKIFPNQLSKSNSKPLSSIITGMSVSTGDTSFKYVDINTKIIVNPSDNNIGFDFLSINLQNPERTQYRCVLKSKKRQWSNLTKNRHLSFNNLPPDDYIFSVKASANNSYANASTTIISFTILPPFWQTTWFIILAIIVFIAFMVLTVWYVKQREEKKNKGKMEVLTLKNQALTRQMDNHFIVNITSQIVLLYENNRIKEGNKFTRKFSRFLQQNLEFMRKETITLAEEIALIENYIFLETIHKENFKFIKTVDKNIQLEQIVVPPLLIQPIIENAVKYGVKKNLSAENTIMLTIKEIPQGINIIVEDNGPGFQSEQNDARQSNNVSMKIIRDRLNLIGGISSLNIVSNKSGTKVIINIQSKPT